MGRAGKGGEGCIPIPRPPFWGRTCHGPRHRGDTRLDHPDPNIIPIPTSPPIPKPNQRERKAENTGLAPTLQGLFLLGQAGGGVPSPQPPPLPPGLVPEPKGQVEETGALRENPGGENPPHCPHSTTLHPRPRSPSTPSTRQRAIHLLLLQNCLCSFPTNTEKHKKNLKPTRAVPPPLPHRCSP